MIRLPEHWNIRPLLYLQILGLLLRRFRSSGVVVVGHFPFWAYSDGKHLGRGARVRLDGKTKYLGSTIAHPRYFRARADRDVYHLELFVSPDFSDEFKLDSLRRSAKYLVYLEPARKDGTRVIAEVCRVDRQGAMSFTAVPVRSTSNRAD